MVKPSKKERKSNYLLFFKTSKPALKLSLERFLFDLQRQFSRVFESRFVRQEFLVQKKVLAVQAIEQEHRCVLKHCREPENCLLVSKEKMLLGSRVAVNPSFIVAHHCKGGNFSPYFSFGSTHGTTSPRMLHRRASVSLFKVVSSPKKKKTISVGSFHHWTKSCLLIKLYRVNVDCGVPDKVRALTGALVVTNSCLSLICPAFFPNIKGIYENHTLQVDCRKRVHLTNWPPSSYKFLVD